MFYRVLRKKATMVRKGNAGHLTIHEVYGVETYFAGDSLKDSMVLKALEKGQLLDGERNILNGLLERLASRN